MVGDWDDVDVSGAAFVRAKLMNNVGVTIGVGNNVGKLTPSLIDLSHADSKTAIKANMNDRFIVSFLL